MAKRKKWNDIGSEADLQRVKIGSRIRNKETGEEFTVTKIGDMVNGVLQVEGKRTVESWTTFEYRDGRWGFA